MQMIPLVKGLICIKFLYKYTLSTYKKKVINILTVSVSSLYYKHTINSKLKMNSYHSKPVIVINVVSSEIRTYSFIKQATENIKTSSTTIIKYTSNKVYGIYMITKKGSLT